MYQLQNLNHLKKNTKSATHQSAFSLLELLVAMSILAFALVALLGHQGVSIQMSDYSNKMSQAIFLAESKLLDIENDILTDSIDAYDNCQEGNFKSEGLKKFKWKACTFKLEVAEGASEMITERFMSIFTGLGAGLGEGGSGSSDASKSSSSSPTPNSSAMGNAMGSAMGSSAMGSSAMGSGAMGMGGGNPMEQAMGQVAMATGMIPTFLQQLQDQIRKVKLEITWKDSTQERRFVVERFITSLGSDLGAPEDNLANENIKQVQNQAANSGMPMPPPQAPKR
jgi:prepilin-type N-terminal cleavage/methylation domain-containing protein